MPRRLKLKILFSEASSLSARQTLYALGPAGYTIDVLDPQPLCLARFSRYVRAWHRCPPFANDPVGYLEFVNDRLRAEHYDVLLPVHDQIFLLSRFRAELSAHVGLAVPEFKALERVQNKAEFMRLLDELRLPQPPTVAVSSRNELEEFCEGWKKGSGIFCAKHPPGRSGKRFPTPFSSPEYPCFVKLVYSTAGRGVWYVRNCGEMQRVGDELEKRGSLNGQSEILIQQPAQGALCVVQSVFQHGRLVAAHSYQARAIGVGGSARARVSVSQPMVLEHLRRIGTHLGWHGALHMEYFYDAATGCPTYIEANPRIGETVGATLSGVNLCELLVQVSLNRPLKPPPSSRPGVRTHSVVMSLLALAEQGSGRRALLAELWRAWTHQGVYQNSQDDLTRPREDLLSLLPAGAVLLQLLADPDRARSIVTRTVDNYALSEAAVRTIRQLPIETIARRLGGDRTETRLPAFTSECEQSHGSRHAIA